MNFIISKERGITKDRRTTDRRSTLESNVGGGACAHVTKPIKQNYSTEFALLNEIDVTFYSTSQHTVTQYTENSVLYTLKCL